MELDTKPGDAVLIVEFYDEKVAERLAMMQARRLGLRSKILTSAREMNLVWGVRKAGLSLLTGCVGPVKPVAFIEDAAVRPAQLPEYVRGLESIMRPIGLEASYYGHAASGLLHVRPVIDLHDANDLKKIPDGGRSDFGAGETIQRFARGRARRWHRAHRIHARTTRQRTA